MKVAILGKANPSYEEKRLIEEGEKKFKKTVYIPIPLVRFEKKGNSFSVKFKDHNLLDFDAVIPRVVSSYREHAFNILSVLKKPFIPIKPHSLYYAHNKFLTLALLNKHRIPVPKTFLSMKRNILEDILENIEYPIVLKLLYGSLGKGVMFADSKTSARSFMDTLEKFNEPIFVEEFVENPGEDIRIYVVGGEVVAGMKRIVEKDEKRANIGIGGKAKRYEVPEEYKRLALKAAEALDIKICGVDIMEGPEEPIIIEVNVNAQFKGLEKISGANIAKRIIEYVSREIE